MLSEMGSHSRILSRGTWTNLRFSKTAGSWVQVRDIVAETTVVVMEVVRRGQVRDMSWRANRISGRIQGRVWEKGVQGWFPIGRMELPSIQVRRTIGRAGLFVIFLSGGSGHNDNTSSLMVRGMRVEDHRFLSSVHPHNDTLRYCRSLELTERHLPRAPGLSTLPWRITRSGLGYW